MKTGNLIDNELQRLKTECALLIDERDRLQRHLLSMTAIWDAVLERETKAIAHELHGDLGQLLTALRMDISLFLLQHQADAVLTGKANGMLALTDRCMQSISRLINTLSISHFEHGLASALECLCRDFSRRYSVPCALTIPSECNGLDDTHNTVLFRILHEALSNIARHAGSCTANIVFRQATDAGLHIEIRDTGRGFDPSTLTDDKGLGLPLMRASTVALGGQIEIISEKNSGTKLTLHIPAESPNRQKHLA